VKFADGHARYRVFYRAILTVGSKTFLSSTCFFSLSVLFY